MTSVHVLFARVEMLERTVLELGSELAQQKSSAGKQRESHEQVLAILKGLKQLLDEKGVVSVDDFDAAVELGEAIETFNAQANVSLADAMDRMKKNGH